MCAVVGEYDLNDDGKNVLRPALDKLKKLRNRTSHGWGVTALDFQSGTFHTHQTLNDIRGDAVIEGREQLPPAFNSRAVLVHGRYPTAGASLLENTQPMENDPDGFLPPDQRFVIVFNGTIANAEKYRQELLQHGVTFTGTSDTEVLMRLIEHIAEKPHNNFSWQKVFQELEEKIDGGCSLLLLDGTGNFVAYRNSPGLTPLWFAETNNRLIAASETHAFEGITNSFQEVSPGQVIIYDPASNTVNRHDTNLRNRHEKEKLNAAEVLYTANAQSITKGQHNFKTRRDIGRGMAHYMAPRIAQMTPEDRDKILVVGIPNTGGAYGEGFTEGLVRQGLIAPLAYPEGMRRIPQAKNDRSFMAATEKERLARAEKKHKVIPEDVEGKIIFAFDDTLVRSYTSRVITRKLWQAGAEAIHWVFGAPPVIGGDFYGIDIPSLDELAFWQIWRESTTADQKHLFQRNTSGSIHVDLDLFGKKTAVRLLEAARNDLVQSGSWVPDFIPVTATFTPLEILEKNLPGGGDCYSYHLFDGAYPTRMGQVLFNQQLDMLFKLAA